MRSQDTRPDPGLASATAGTIEADFEHLLDCWPRNHLNGETRHVAGWCGWERADALERLVRLSEAGLLAGGRPQTPKAGLISETEAAETDEEVFRFWLRPSGARGFPPTEPRLAALGIYRAFVDGNVCTYQGEPEFVVRRRARLKGESLAGYRLVLDGPSPSHPHQLGFAEVR